MPKTLVLSTLLAMSFEFLIVFAPSFVASAGGEPVILIVIDSKGVVHVNVTALIEPGIHWFECPVEPISVTIIVSIDGKPIPAIYYNDSVMVISDRLGYVTVSYIINATLEGGEIRFWYGYAREATLVVPPNIILTSLPESLVKAYVGDDGNLRLVFKGPSTISFVVGQQGQLQTQVPKTPDQAPAPPIALPSSDLLWYAVAALAVVAIAVIAHRATKRMRRDFVSTAYLDEVDREILERIRKHGGEVVQSILYRELNIPKATLWRHVKRLEKLGYVAVERVGRDNRVKLLK